MREPKQGALRSLRMSTFTITIVNEEFSASEQRECENAPSARTHAVKSALDIAAEQVAAGRPFFAAHVTIREDERDELTHLVVSAGAAPLKM
jgi:hypothetical protein